MLPTWFLSMWISNTATASMMVPIAAAVLDQVKAVKTGESGGGGGGGGGERIEGRRRVGD